MIPEKVIFGTDMDGNISSIQQVLQTIWPNLSICSTYLPLCILFPFYKQILKTNLESSQILKMNKFS